MSVRRDSLRTLAFQVFALGAGAVTNIVMARTLGPDGKGLISFLAYSLFVTVSLGGMGLHAAAIQHVGKKRFPPETIAATQIVLGLGIGCVCAVLVALLLPVFGKRMDLPAGVLIGFLPLVILSLLLLNLSGLVIGLGRIRALNIIRILTPFGWTAGVILVLAVLRGDRNAATYTWLGTQAISPLVMVAWIFARVRPRFESVKACARGAFRFGVEAYLANLIWVLVLRAGGLILGNIRGSEAVGIFSVAVLLGEMLWYVPRSLTLALNPRIASGRQEEALHLTHRAVRIGIWSVLVMSIGLLIVVRPLILFTFKAAFLPSIRPLTWLLPGVVLGTVSSPLALYFTQHLGKPRINAVTAAVGLAVNLALNLLWIPRYGASGAAAASSVAYALVAAQLVWRFRREPGFSWLHLLWLRGDDVLIVRDTIRSFFKGGAR